MAIPKARPFHSCVSDFKSGKDTPRAFLDRCLEAVATFEKDVGAFVVMDIEGAKAAADRSTERWRAGNPLSRIDGMPVGIKDIIDSVDLPTQMGSPIFDGWQAGRDAATTAALREAGAVILGKTVTTEFAATFPGGTRNPWDAKRTPGGSSSGSAASVACGMVSAALGTQVIGSILRPASFCGVVGFKPTMGALNRGGSHDGLSQSAHGPLAASLEDAWLVAHEIARRVGGDPGFPGLYGGQEPPRASSPVRLAVLETAGWAVAEAGVKVAFAGALGKLEAKGVDLVRASSRKHVSALEAALVRAVDVSRDINAWESLWPLNTYSIRYPGKLSQSMLDRLADARKMSPDDYRALLVERERVRALYAELAGDCDACITLSAAGPAPVGLGSTGNPVFNVPASLLGTPALTLPVFMVDGLPVGLQLMGFKDRDESLFRVAAWVRAGLGG